MNLAENVLFSLARYLYQRNMGESAEMTAALSDFDQYAVYRKECVRKVLNAAAKRNVSVKGQAVLDLGCFDGAMSWGYLEAGAAHVYGVDIDAPAVEKAQQRYIDNRIEFHTGTISHIPLADESVDTILSYDVFEHVENVQEILDECYRVLKPGGKLLIGTWGWHHPFAPHLWSIMAVPWAHCVVSEKTLLRVCNRIYNSDWYRPNMHDFDQNGKRIENKFTEEEISTSYLNKFLVSDFEREFQRSKFDFTVYPERFSSKWAAWTAPLIRMPWIREYCTAYIWVVLQRPVARSLRNNRRQEAPELVSC